LAFKRDSTRGFSISLLPWKVNHRASEARLSASDFLVWSPQYPFVEEEVKSHLSLDSTARVKWIGLMGLKSASYRYAMTLQRHLSGQ
jgi:hypothetical protein